MEEAVCEKKKLNPNVDFYSASTYYSLGIPIDLFTPIFAVSRMSGWTAHVLEQYRNNRLIRPQRITPVHRTGRSGSRSRNAVDPECTILVRSAAAWIGIGIA